MALAAALGPGLTSSVLAVAFVRIPVYVRLVPLPSAVAAGAGIRRSGGGARARPRPRMLLRHLLPNSLAPVIVQATLDVGSAMLLTATLSFLGLGVRAPAAEWGAMVNSGRGVPHRSMVVRHLPRRRHFPDRRRL